MASAGSRLPPAECGGAIGSLQRRAPERSRLPADAITPPWGVETPRRCWRFNRATSYSISDRAADRRAAVCETGRPSGKAFGLDMTDEMLALARENQRKAGPPT